MKRHPALEALSRDHHHALVVAQKLARADAGSAGAAASAFLDFWEREGRNHFRMEEEVLLPAYAAHGDPEDPAVARTLVDHVVIRRDAERVAGEPSVAILNELGRRLTAHVRHEERTLFGLIERAVPGDELEALADRLAAAPPPA